MFPFISGGLGALAGPGLANLLGGGGGGSSSSSSSVPAASNSSTRCHSLFKLFLDAFCVCIINQNGFNSDSQLDMTGWCSSSGFFQSAHSHPYLHSQPGRHLPGAHHSHPHLRSLPHNHHPLHACCVLSGGRGSDPYAAHPAERPAEHPGNHERACQWSGR